MQDEDPAELYPNFFLVGAVKSGTTAMHSYLGTHPQIGMSAEKEPYFFGSDLGARRPWTDSVDTYATLFEHCRGRPVRGESSPGYLLSSTAASEIHEFCPSAKILILLRNPIDLLYSLHSQLHYMAVEPNADFGVALAASRAEIMPSAPQALPHRWRRYDEVVRFDEQIRRYYSSFGTEQVKVVIYDDFIADPSATYAEILTFLDVDPGHSAEFTPMNTNKSTRSRVLQRVLVTPPAWLTVPVRRLTPYPLRARLRLRAIEANSVANQRVHMTEELRDQLRAELQQETDAVSALLGRDLTQLWLRATPDQADVTDA
jgi:hypothetical protein